MDKKRVLSGLQKIAKFCERHQARVLAVRNFAHVLAEAMRAVRAFPDKKHSRIGGQTTATRYTKEQRTEWGKLGGRPRKNKAAAETKV